MSAPLASVTVVLDATGGGRAEVGPGRYGVKWNVNRLVTSATNAVQLRVYSGYVSPATQIDSTRDGGGDTSEITNGLLLNAADKLIFVYSVGTVGDRATAVIWGDVSR